MTVAVSQFSHFTHRRMRATMLAGSREFAS